MHALQRAIAAACLDASAGEEMERDLRGFLGRFGVASDDVEAILAAPRGLAVYRTLVRNGLSGIVSRVLGRTRRRMNAACDGRFDADFAGFVERIGPRTHYLRDIPGELVAWAAPRWRSDASVPPYLADLAEYEVMHFAVAAAETANHSAGAGAVAGGAIRLDRPLAGGAIRLDRPLAFDGSARVVRTRWAVHELPADEGDLTGPEPRDVRLFVYRDGEHRVRWLELSVLASAILERLLAGEPLGAAVERACGDHATAPGRVLPDIARLLADLGERGALLGGAG